MAKNPFRALCLPILTALCLAACQPLFNPQPTADPALAAFPARSVYAPGQRPRAGDTIAPAYIPIP